MRKRNINGHKAAVGIAVTVMMVGIGSTAHALSFNFSSTGNADVDAGFVAAGNLWSSLFTDNVTVNITAGFSNLGTTPGGNIILGGTTSTHGFVGYANARSAMSTDQSSADDTTAVANLAAGPLDIYINRTSNNPDGSGSATPYLDSDGGPNNSTIRMTSAKAKALALLAGNNAGVDAIIQFNDQVAWDFDQSDDIGSGQLDFLGTALHELGHAMGFSSGIGVLDENSPPGGGPFLDNDFIFVSVLDLFRHSDDSFAAGADIDWTADTRDKYFSIDGGTTNLTMGDTRR